ncbi:MAG: hypothetical protein IKI31_04860, partial [Treponema sp.]|nr:hypothetical protein [Treponema sp.]
GSEDWDWEEYKYVDENGEEYYTVDMVPSSFKKGVNRTYLSSPYFDSLASMNRTLEQQMNSFSDIINQGTLDAFTVLYIEDYMCMHPASSAVKNLLSSASNVDEKSLTVMQAVGILRVYEKLLSHNEELSLLLSGALDKCVNKLSASCIAEDNALTVSENGTFVSVVQAAEIGSALIKYGKASGKNALMSAGYLIINSYLQENSSFDLRTLSAVYPYVAYENKFLPHFELLGFDRSGAVYAWTCANEMSFQKDESGATVLKIDFPETYTHYLIINGILPFRTIYIYDISFRTDPRFETYNSSGYVYNANTGTMLLKSRHKSKIETVRLVHGSASQSGSSTTSTSSQAATSSSTVQDAQGSSASE